MHVPYSYRIRAVEVQSVLGFPWNIQSLECRNPHRHTLIADVSAVWRLIDDVVFKPALLIAVRAASLDLVARLALVQFKTRRILPDEVNTPDLTLGAKSSC